MNARLFQPIVVTLALVALLGADAPKRQMEIVWVDVDGGAATLIVTPERESILIDTGWPGFGDRDAKRIERAVHEVCKLDHIDHLVTTHWHRDHFGGLGALTKLVRIDHYWDRGLPDLDAPDQDAKNFPDGPKRDDPLGIAYRTASEGKRTTLKAGDRLPLKGHLRAIVLASGGETISVEKRWGNERKSAGGDANPHCAESVPDHPVDHSDNARSLAILFELGDFTFLDCGDLTWNVEKKLVCPVDLIGRVDLYQVTHHGLDMSNHPTLLRTIEPTVTIMNNGAKKGCEPTTVATLKSIASIRAMYQLHKDPRARDADDSLIANKTAAGGEFIRVRIEPDGKSFGVQLGERSAVRSFASR